jgi:DNA-binding transcriptional MerR regulator
MAKPGTDDTTCPGSRYRTASVARMLRMPAATLRIWERRYGVAAPATTPGGHRQYSTADVQRLALIRQLTSLGHSIGSLARLDIEQLKEVASTHATALTAAPAPRRRSPACRKVAVVGLGAEQRLRRAAVRMRPGSRLQVVTAFDRLADVRRSAPASRHDALIVFVDGLQAPLLPKVQAAARALEARHTAVIHSFAATSVAHSFVAAGIALLREPADDASLAGWLATLESDSLRRSRAGTVADRAAPMLPVAPAAAPLHRYDDAMLADIAGLSSTIACECPRHLANIVMQLSHFEAYSEQCRNLDAADAALHAYLAQVTATARALFESALEQVAIHEGLMLP